MNPSICVTWTRLLLMRVMWSTPADRSVSTNALQLRRFDFPAKCVHVDLRRFQCVRVTPSVGELMPPRVWHPENWGWVGTMWLLSRQLQIGISCGHSASRAWCFQVAMALLHTAACHGITEMIALYIVSKFQMMGQAKGPPVLVTGHRHARATVLGLEVTEQRAPLPAAIYSYWACARRFRLG